MQRALMWLNLYGHEAQKRPKNTKNAFFACFWAYVGQPHDHISWATPMPFASINSTNPRTNPWNFHEKILRIGGAGKWGFFESAILKFFFQKKKKNFASSQWKLVQIYRIARIFRKFDDYPCFQPQTTPAY